MSAPEKIAAEQRTEFGKGAARRIRRDNKIPAVIYGHGNDPIHVTLPGHQTMMALKHGGANALLALDIDGSEQLALTKDVQVDPIRRVIEHIDFVAVRRGEKVTVDVPIHVVGDAAPETLVVTENAVVSGRGRGHPHPRVHRGLGRGRRRRHPDPRQGPRPPVGHDAARRRGAPHRQRDRADLRRGPRGRAGGGRGRGRHRARRRRLRDRRGPGRGRRRGRQDRGRRPRSDLRDLVADARVSRCRRYRRHGSDDHERRRLAGGRPGQPRADLRRPPPQHRLPRRRRAGLADGQSLQVAQDRARRRRRGPPVAWVGPRVVLARAAAT